MSPSAGAAAFELAWANEVPWIKGELPHRIFRRAPGGDALLINWAGVDSEGNHLTDGTYHHQAEVELHTLGPRLRHLHGLGREHQIIMKPTLKEKKQL